jgi:hypothetical protein
MAGQPPVSRRLKIFYWGFFNLDQKSAKITILIQLDLLRRISSSAILAATHISVQMEFLVATTFARFSRAAKR